MQIHTIYHPMQDDFTQCMVSNSRRAARAITRRYDAYARPFGITSTQFSLLGGIVMAGERTVSELAEICGIERTTLTRNLDRLESLGLVASQASGGGNGRICGLTEEGRSLLRKMLPVWRRAQAEIRESLGPDGFDTTISTLKRLADV
ncbi:MAG: MarR family winged helix-turn-helix transcriptional regulator [Devosia sp.]|uniref:MarR family winged helix-turn-helix transcriptional regulator n=1 Tax=Devosia sp. TaxID=1871048 RepID=UPI0037BF9E5B